MGSTGITVAFVLTGVLFVVLGIPMATGRVPPNRWYGFRTARTLASERVWYAANRLQGIDLCVAGAVSTVAAILFFVLAKDWSVSLIALANTAVLTITLTLALLHGFMSLRKMQ